MLDSNSNYPQHIADQDKKNRQSNVNYHQENNLSNKHPKPQQSIAAYNFTKPNKNLSFSHQKSKNKSQHEQTLKYRYLESPDRALNKKYTPKHQYLNSQKKSYGPQLKEQEYTPKSFRYEQKNPLHQQYYGKQGKFQDGNHALQYVSYESRLKQIQGDDKLQLMEHQFSPYQSKVQLEGTLNSNQNDRVSLSHYETIIAQQNHELTVCKDQASKLKLQIETLKEKNRTGQTQRQKLKECARAAEQKWALEEKRVNQMQGRQTMAMKQQISSLLFKNQLLQKQLHNFHKHLLQNNYTNRQKTTSLHRPHAGQIYQSTGKDHNFSYRHQKTRDFNDKSMRRYSHDKSFAKYEEFVQRVIQMHFKITGQKLTSGNELKELWKWLKTMGLQYSKQKLN